VRLDSSYWNIPRPAGKARDDRARWPSGPYVWASIATAVIGLAVSVAAGLTVSVWESRLAEQELSARAQSHAMILQTGINEHISKVAAVRALFQSDSAVTRQEFLAFSEFLLTDQADILTVSWIPRVTHADRIAHELAAVSDGISGYRIRPAAAAGDESFPLYYSSKAGPSSRLLGLDLNDGGPRQETLERARDQDQTTYSPSLALDTDDGDRNAVFFVQPVYRKDLPHDTVEDRRRNLIGFVRGVFQAGSLIETILRATAIPGGLDLYFFAAESVGSETPFYFHPSRLRTTPTSALSQAALISGQHWSHELNIGDGRWTFVAAPIPGGPGTAAHYIAWLVMTFGLSISGIVVAYIWTSGRRSLSALNFANKQLQAQNMRFDTALNNMMQGLVMFDAAERLVVCNNQYIEMYRLSRDIVKPGCSLRELLIHCAERDDLCRDPDQYRAELSAKLTPRKSANFVEATADGREISVASRPMPNGGWVVTHEDITERRKAEAEISHMALHDALTNLPNRRLLHEQLADRFTHRSRDQKFALLCLDLDRFKAVNDTLGHPYGDKLLRQVAERMAGCLREGDIIARLGGDEFAIIQGDIKQPNDAAVLAARLNAATPAPFDLDGHQVVIGVSIGIAIAPTDAADADQLLKSADMALYRAKSDGRGTYRFFESEMDTLLQKRRALELDLRKALVNGEFELYYQPLVNLKTQKISGFEALIRWNHPERGLFSPLDFIPLAEETALIVPIGEWVLRQACGEAMRWPNQISIAVNLSPVQFKTRDLLQTVKSALKHSGLPAKRLDLEITESVLLVDDKSTLETLHQLHNLGVRISMDDFGTGYSSLSYLRSFPFDKIKIDQSFVRDLASNPDSKAIIRAVMGLGNSLRMATTAEGIETQEELDYLTREGCTEAQGYFFSKPRPAHEVLQLLSRQRSKAVA
jgi:diguanylate cyclase (GGDEF)-like protein